jgi:hypothetical protein
MMLSRGFVVWLALPVLISCVGVGYEARLIEAVSRNAARSLERKDFDTFAAFFASDFSCSTSDGRILDRKQFLNAVATELRTAIAPITIAVKQTRLEIDGNSATSATDETTEYSVKDAQGGLHRLRYSQRMESRLSKLGERWVYKSINYPGNATQYLDGQPVDANTLRRMLQK